MNIYLLDSMKYAPFVMKEGVQILNDHGIFITDSPDKTDVIVGEYFPLRKSEYFNLFNFKRGTNLLIWTYEPRYTVRETSKHLYLPGITVHQMNLYTCDVYLDNYTFVGQLKEPLAKMTSKEYEQKNHKMVALVTWVKVRRNRELWKNGKYIDLILPRQDFLLEGYNKGYIDIFGSNWPKKIAKGDSRSQDDWPDVKVRVAKDYRYCMSMENTNWPYYVTEKIWQSIVAGCLPVYAGSAGTIYEDFEKGSFIDYTEFEDNQECFDFINNMSRQSFLDRYNSCIETVNSIYGKIDTHHYFPGCMMQGIINRLNKLNAETSLFV